MATIGNSSVRCGPDDIICNGPLDSNAQYGVRYTLFSGDQSQEYPFFEQAQFTTGECVYVSFISTVYIHWLALGYMLDH